MSDCNLPSNSDGELSSAEAKARLATLRQEINQAAACAKRDPSEITLLGVSKTFSAECVKLYIDVGLKTFGESYMNEARPKIEALNQLTPDLNWHFTGQLQTNKAKYAAKLFSTIHSLDRLELAAELDRQAATREKILDVYIQVNVAGENSKAGLSPLDLPRFIKDIEQYKSLNIKGLMTLPPYDPNPELSRPYFRALKLLRNENLPPNSGLSMGMSGDFKVAIDEGATVVRIGTSLFGSRY